MSHLRLYLDEDAMRKSLVLGLRARGIDVLTANEADMVNRPDEDHLTTATGLDRVLYSYNTADYCVIHGHWMARGQSHSGIIVAPQQRYSTGDEIRRLLHLCHANTPSRMKNSIEFLSAW